jgi:hypothetical protein
MIYFSGACRGFGTRNLARGTRNPASGMSLVKPFEVKRSTLYALQNKVVIN